MPSSLLKSAFTGKDNQSIDIGLILWFMSSFALLMFTGFAVIWHGQQFDPMSTAGAMSAIAIGHAGAQKVKATTEPGG